MRCLHDYIYRYISIHAPSRERPDYFGRYSEDIFISIHAPSRERLYPNGSQDTDRRISIHAPSRERLTKIVTRALSGIISIHAPSRERRLPFRSYWLIWNISIHAPSRERLCCSPCCNCSQPAFQSTLPHGSDRLLCKMILLICNFNPRSLTGATRHTHRNTKSGS